MFKPTQIASLGSLFYLAFFIFLLLPDSLAGFERSVFCNNAVNENGEFSGKEFTFQIDLPSFKTKLLSAPVESRFSKNIKKTTVSFPLPSGKKADFFIVEAPIMETSGEKLYDYKSYAAYNAETGEMEGRFSTSKNGVNGIFENKGRLFSIKSIDNVTHRSVYDENFMSEGCDLAFDEELKTFTQNDNEKKKSDFQYGQFLRIFRIAVTNRGELAERAAQTGMHLPTILADIINQVNFIYEKELSIRLQVITPIQIFYDKNTDPFTTANTFDLISEAKTTIDQLYAGKNYDLGHLFGYFGGGRAYLKSVCGTNKSGAVTGVDLPISSPFLKLFAHELGHQFGAGHSFNSNGAFCGQNLFPGSAYEIGSGSTLMSYAGSCVNENVESIRSQYFNAGALEEINTFVENKIVQGCGTAIWKGNQPPNVSTPQTKVIPARTPFFLTGSGQDPEGQSLKFSWEQHDLGPVGLVGNEAAARPSVPLFRVFDPTDSPTRFFPEKSAILNNNNITEWEILPQVSREMEFYLTARDGYGGVGCDELKLQVHDTGIPFFIRSFNDAQVINSGSSVDIFWEPAGTGSPPVSTQGVDILLSIDGGTTFPISLARNTPNDGEEVITFPDLESDRVRIMIRGTNNYFFDINNGDLKLIRDVQPPSNQEFLELDFSATPTDYRQWSHVVFTTVVKNTGNSSINDVEIDFTIPDHKLVFSTSSTGFGFYNSINKKWRIPRIAPGGSAILSFTYFTLVKEEVLEITATQQGTGLSRGIVLRPFNSNNLRPDLYLRLLKSPAEADPGQFLTSELFIHNGGTDAARGNFTIGIYLSKDSNLDASDELIGNIATGNIPVGALPTAAGFFTPGNKLPGDYFLIYMIDNQSVIAELNEGNNIISSYFKIKGMIPPPPGDCNISIISSQKSCFDNGTPSNPDDDRFSFNLMFSKPDNQPGNFQAQVGDISRTGEYGGTYIFGPFPISEGNVTGYVEDLFSPNCFNHFEITPTAACSDKVVTGYCTSTGNHPWHEWIAGVDFAGRQNSSGKMTYSDFTDNPISVNPGQHVNIKLTAGFSWFTADEYFRVWLDSNGDGQFLSSEILFEDFLPAPPDGTPKGSISGIVKIPDNSNFGQTRMRVAMKRGSYPDSCGDINFGEVEDYLIQIGGN